MARRRRRRLPRTIRCVGWRKGEECRSGGRSGTRGYTSWTGRWKRWGWEWRGGSISAGRGGGGGSLIRGGGRGGGVGAGGVRPEWRERSISAGREWRGVT